MPKIKNPFGQANVVALTATGAQAITIEDELTIVDGQTVIATGNRTLNLTISSEIKAGASIFLKSRTTATETTVPGTGMTAPTITGVAGKIFCAKYIYDGITFKPVAAAVQID
jgi:hypothetical protein